MGCWRNSKKSMHRREVFVESLSSYEPENLDCVREAVCTHLTPMQWKILHGVHSGLLNKQIAFDLGIAEATVKAHMTALMRKLNVRNRTQVALAAQAMKHDTRQASVLAAE
jgi:DNA-binding NarL/FixJ family response regulator